MEHFGLDVHEYPAIHRSSTDCSNRISWDIKIGDIPHTSRIISHVVVDVILSCTLKCNPPNMNHLLQVILKVERPSQVLVPNQIVESQIHRIFTILHQSFKKVDGFVDGRTTTKDWDQV